VNAICPVFYSKILPDKTGVLQTQLTHLRQRWRCGEMSDAAYAALYVLFWKISLHGRRFASRKYKQDLRADHLGWLDAVSKESGPGLADLLCHYFERYNFLGVIANVNVALCAWLQGRWSLRLFERIPTPYELLDMQVQGERVVTVWSEFPRAMQPVLNKPNAFAFMLHDLEHAYKFFHDPELHAGQKRFFVQVREMAANELLQHCMKDSLFAEKFHYLISDMNTHPLHGLQYLQAILIEHYLQRLGKSACEALPKAAHEEINAMLCQFDCYAALQGDRYQEDAMDTPLYQVV